ncbi:MAG: tRNA lysidine(34) synthetase TilS [Fodinibius sp.]|nr:tRNA lysidine(34) synthetase TilS [Fodinibius sp.]
MSRSDLSPIEQAVHANLDHHFSDVASPVFVTAVSGGMDSMCLLHVLNKLDIEVIVSHINYQKRGQASDRDAELVEEAARRLGLRCDIAKADPNQADGQNFQQWARRLRYRQFRSLKQQYDADGIALAHHEDDQVETILQKVFRGAGLGQLVGDGGVGRPEISSAVTKYRVLKLRAMFRSMRFRIAPMNRTWSRILRAIFCVMSGWQSWGSFSRAGRRMCCASRSRPRFLGRRWIGLPTKSAEGNRLKRDAFGTLPPALQRALVLRIAKEAGAGCAVER